MSLHLTETNQRIEELESFLDPSSGRFGRLLNWQNPPDPFWHYGIGLSDSHIFDTGQGLRAFERKEAKLVMGVDDISFSPSQTIERLKHALHVFSDWEYTFTGWNCEHLSRLVATNQPRCYQSSVIWWLCDMSPEGDHKMAQQIFHEYLLDVAPSLTR